jgi:hypothetical protein
MSSPASAVLGDVLVLSAALFFAGMGVWALARPARVVDRFGTEVTTVAGRNEVSAVYGGFGLAVAGLLVWAAATEGRGELWIPSVVAVLAFGMAVGRLVAMVRDRATGGRPVWFFLGVEVVLAVALFGSHTLR